MTAYLAYLAYGMFKRELKSLNPSVYDEIHENYRKHHDIRTWPMEEVRSNLIKSHVLMTYDGGWAFRYKYQYYYFVASYFRDHISDQAILDDIRRLSRSLYVTDFANIMLFLAHLSKDPAIINTLVDTANTIYAGVAPVEYKEDTLFLDSLVKAVETIRLEDRDPSAVRRAMMEAQDAREILETPRDIDHPQDVEHSALDPLSQINMALKTQQICGQILKNFPGSLDGDTKVILALACFGIGSRTLGFLFEGMRKDETQYIQDIVDTLRTENAALTLEEARGQACETLVGLARLASYGLTKRTAIAVGAPELSGTYERLDRDFGSLATSLTNLAVALEQDGEFPEAALRKLLGLVRRPGLAFTTIQWLIAERFALFPVDFRRKQRVGEMVGIEMKALRAVDPERKLLAPVS